MRKYNIVKYIDIDNKSVMLSDKWVQKIEKDLSIYRQYNVLIYKYYLDNIGYIDMSYSGGTIGHFLDIEYWDYDEWQNPRDITVYYKAKVSNKVVMVEGITYYLGEDSEWNYHHLWWEFYSIYKV